VPIPTRSGITEIEFPIIKAWEMEAASEIYEWMTEKE
jgi:hypothetical protein